MKKVYQCPNCPDTYSGRNKVMCERCYEKEFDLLVQMSLEQRILSRDYSDKVSIDKPTGKPCSNGSCSKNSKSKKLPYCPSEDRIGRGNKCRVRKHPISSDNAEDKDE